MQEPPARADPSSPFEANPAPVTFDGYSGTGSYKAVLSMRNRTNTSKPIHVLASTNPYFSFKALSFDSAGSQVPPGLTAKYEITFNPDSDLNFSYEVTLVSGATTMTVPIICTCKKPQIKFPSSLDFGEVLTGVCVEKSVKVCNNTTEQVELCFRVSPLDEEEGEEVDKEVDDKIPFYIPSQHLSIPACSVGFISILFRGEQDWIVCGAEVEIHKNFISQITHPDDNSSLVGKIVLHAETIPPTPELSSPSVLFPPAYVGSVLKDKITISNPHPLPLRFRWMSKKSRKGDTTTMSRRDMALLGDGNGDTQRSISAGEGDEYGQPFKHRVFEVTPNQGILYPSTAIEVSITFTPKEASGYTGIAWLALGGTKTETGEITRDNEGLFTRRVPLQLSGVGVGPTVEFECDVLDIGDMTVLEEGAWKTTLKNVGKIPASFNMLLKDPSKGCFSGAGGSVGGFVAGVQGSQDDPNSPISNADECFVSNDVLYGNDFSRLKSVNPIQLPFGSIIFSPSNGVIPPGGAAEIQVNVVSDVVGPFKNETLWEIEGISTLVSLVIQGFIKPPLLKATPPTLSFGEIPFGSKEYREIIIENEGPTGIVVDLAICLDERERDSQKAQNAIKDFQVEETSLIVGPSAPSAIHLSLSPINYVGAYPRGLSIILTSKYGVLLTIPVSAIISIPILKVTPPVINLGDIWYGKAAYGEIIVENTSDNVLGKFTIDEGTAVEETRPNQRRRRKNPTLSMVKDEEGNADDDRGINSTVESNGRCGESGDCESSGFGDVSDYNIEEDLDNNRPDGNLGVPKGYQLTFFPAKGTLRPFEQTTIRIELLCKKTGNISIPFFASFDGWKEAEQSRTTLMLSTSIHCPTISTIPQRSLEFGKVKSLVPLLKTVEIENTSEIYTMAVLGIIPPVSKSKQGLTLAGHMAVSSDVERGLIEKYSDFTQLPLGNKYFQITSGRIFLIPGHEVCHVTVEACLNSPNNILKTGRLLIFYFAPPDMLIDRESPMFNETGGVYSQERLESFLRNTEIPTPLAVKIIELTASSIGTTLMAPMLGVVDGALRVKLKPCLISESIGFPLCVENHGELNKIIVIDKAPGAVDPESHKASLCLMATPQRCEVEKGTFTTVILSGIYKRLAKVPLPDATPESFVCPFKETWTIKESASTTQKPKSAFSFIVEGCFYNLIPKVFISDNIGDENIRRPFTNQRAHETHSYKELDADNGLYFRYAEFPKPNIIPKRLTSRNIVIDNPLPIPINIKISVSLPLSIVDDINLDDLQYAQSYSQVVFQDSSLTVCVTLNPMVYTNKTNRSEPVSFVVAVTPTQFDPIYYEKPETGVIPEYEYRARFPESPELVVPKMVKAFSGIVKFMYPILEVVGDQASVDFGPGIPGTSVQKTIKLRNPVKINVSASFRFSNQIKKARPPLESQQGAEGASMGTSRSSLASRPLTMSQTSIGELSPPTSAGHNSYQFISNPLSAITSRDGTDLVCPFSVSPSSIYSPGLAPGDSTDITVTYTAPLDSGTKSYKNDLICSIDGGCDLVIPISGGLALEKISYTPQALSFGCMSITTVDYKDITITNQSNVPIVVNVEPTLDVCGTFLTVTPRSTTIQKGKHATFRVGFRPVFPIQITSGITVRAGSMEPIIVPVSGEGRFIQLRMSLPFAPSVDEVGLRWDTLLRAAKGVLIAGATALEATFKNAALSPELFNSVTYSGLEIVDEEGGEDDSFMLPECVTRSNTNYTEPGFIPGNSLESISAFEAFYERVEASSESLSFPPEVSYIAEQLFMVFSISQSLKNSTAADASVPLTTKATRWPRLIQFGSVIRSNATSTKKPEASGASTTFTIVNDSDYKPSLSTDMIALAQNKTSILPDHVQKLDKGASHEILVEFGKSHGLQGIPEGAFAFKGEIAIRGDIPIPIIFTSCICTPRLEVYGPLWNFKCDAISCTGPDTGGIEGGSSPERQPTDLNDTANDLTDRQESDTAPKFSEDSVPRVGSSEDNRESNSRAAESIQKVVSCKSPFEAVFSTKQDLMSYATRVRKFLESEGTEPARDGMDFPSSGLSEDSEAHGAPTTNPAASSSQVYKKYFVATRTINFGAINIGLVKTMSLVLSNTQVIPAPFSILDKSLATKSLAQRKLMAGRPERFIFEPAGGVIPPHQDIRVTATFVPWTQADRHDDFPKAFRSEFLINIKNGETIKLVVCGTALPAPLTVKAADNKKVFGSNFTDPKNDITLSPTIPEVPAYSQFLLTNTSDRPVTIVVGRQGHMDSSLSSGASAVTDTTNGLLSYLPDELPAVEQVQEAPPTKQEGRKKVPEPKGKPKGKGDSKPDGPTTSTSLSVVNAGGRKLSSYADYDKWVVSAPRACISVIFSQTVSQILPTNGKVSAEQLCLDLTAPAASSILLLDVDEILAGEIKGDTAYAQAYKEIEEWRKNRDKAMTEYIILKDEWKRRRRSLGLSTRLQLALKDKGGKQPKRIIKDTKQSATKGKPSKQQQQQQGEEQCGLRPVRPTLPTDPRSTAEYKATLKTVFASRIKKAFGEKQTSDPTGSRPLRIIMLNTLTKKAHCSQVIQAVYECVKELEDNTLPQQGTGGIIPTAVKLSGGAVLSDLYASPAGAGHETPMLRCVLDGNDKSLSDLVRQAEAKAQEANSSASFNTLLTSARSSKAPPKTFRAPQGQAAPKGGKGAQGAPEKKTLDEMVDSIVALSRFDANNEFVRQQLSKGWKKIVKTLTRLAKLEAVDADEKKQEFTEQYPELDEDAQAGGGRKGKHKPAKQPRKTPLKPGKAPEIDYSELEFKVSDFIDISTVSSERVLRRFNLSSLLVQHDEQMCNIDQNKFVEDEFPVPTVLPIPDKTPSANSITQPLNTTHSTSQSPPSTQQTTNDPVLPKTPARLNSSIDTLLDSSKDLLPTAITIEKPKSPLLLVPDNIELWYSDPSQTADAASQLSVCVAGLKKPQDKKPDATKKPPAKPLATKAKQGIPDPTENTPRIPPGFIVVGSTLIKLSVIPQEEETDDKDDTEDGANQSGKLSLPCSITLPPSSRFSVYVRFVTDNIGKDNSVAPHRGRPSEPQTPPQQAKQQGRKSRPGTVPSVEFVMPQKSLVPIVKETMKISMVPRPFCRQLGCDLALFAHSIVPNVTIVASREETTKREDPAMMFTRDKFGLVKLTEYPKMVKLLGLELLDKEFPAPPNTPNSSRSNSPTRSSSRSRPNSKSSSPARRPPKQPTQQQLGGLALPDTTGKQPPAILDNIRGLYRTLTKILRGDIGEDGEESQPDALLIFPVLPTDTQHRDDVLGPSRKLTQRFLSAISKQQQAAEAQRGAKPKQQAQGDNSNAATGLPKSTGPEDEEGDGALSSCQEAKLDPLLPPNVRLFDDIQQDILTVTPHSTSITIVNTQSVPAVVFLSLKSWSDQQLRANVASNILETLQPAKGKKPVAVNASFSSPFDCPDLESVIACVVGAGVDLTEKMRMSMPQGQAQPSPFIAAPFVSVLKPGESTQIHVSCCPFQVGPCEDELTIGIWKARSTTFKRVKLVGFGAKPSAKVSAALCQGEIAPSPPSLETLQKITPPNIRKSLGLEEEPTKGAKPKPTKKQGEQVKDDETSEAKINLVALPRVPRHMSSGQTFTIANTSLLPLAWRVSMLKTNVYEYESMFVVPQFEPDLPVPGSSATSPTSKLLLYQKLPETQPLVGSETPPKCNTLVVKYKSGGLSSCLSVSPCAGYLGAGQQTTIQVEFTSQYETLLCVPLEVAMWEVGEIDASSELVKFALGKAKVGATPNFIKTQMGTVVGNNTCTVPTMPFMPERYSQTPMLTQSNPPPSDVDTEGSLKLFCTRQVHVLAECFAINVKSICFAPVPPSSDSIMYPDGFPSTGAESLEGNPNGLPSPSRQKSDKKQAQGTAAGGQGGRAGNTQREQDTVEFVTDNIPDTTPTGDPANSVCPNTLHFGIVRTGSVHRRGLLLRNNGKHQLVFKTTHVIRSYKEKEIIRIHEDSLTGTLGAANLSQFYTAIAPYYDAIPWSDLAKPESVRNERGMKEMATSRINSSTHRDTAKTSRALPTAEDLLQQTSKVLTFTFSSDDELNFGEDVVKGSHNISIEVYDPVYAKHAKRRVAAKQKTDTSRKLIKINTYAKAVAPKFVVKPDWVLNFDREAEGAEDGATSLAMKRSIEVTNVGVFPFSIALRPLSQMSKEINTVVDEYVEACSLQGPSDPAKAKLARKTPVKGKRETPTTTKKGAATNLSRVDIGPFNIPTAVECIGAHKTKLFEVSYLPPVAATDESGNSIESSLSMEYIVLLVQNSIAEEASLSLRDIQMLSLGKGCSSGPQLPVPFTENIRKALKRMLSVKGNQLPSNFELPLVRLAFSAVHFVPSIVTDPKLCLGGDISLAQYSEGSMAKTQTLRADESKPTQDRDTEAVRESLTKITETNNPHTGPRSVPMPSRYIENINILDFGFVVVDDGGGSTAEHFRVSKTESMRLINPYPIPVAVVLSISDTEDGATETQRVTPKQKQRPKGKAAGEATQETFSLSFSSATIPPSSEKELVITFNPHTLSRTFSATVTCKVVDEDTLLSGTSRDKKKRQTQTKPKGETNKPPALTEYTTTVQPPGVKYAAAAIGKLLTFGLLGSSAIPSVSLVVPEREGDGQLAFGSLKYKDTKRLSLSINNTGSLDAQVKLSIVSQTQPTKPADAKCFRIVGDTGSTDKTVLLVPKGQKSEVTVAFDTSGLDQERVAFEGDEKAKSPIQATLEIVTEQNPSDTKTIALSGSCHRSATDIDFTIVEPRDQDKDKAADPGLFRQLTKVMATALGPSAFFSPITAEAKNIPLFDLHQLPTSKELVVSDTITGTPGPTTHLSIRNNGQTTAKFVVFPLPGVTVHPVMGHLAPDASKDIAVQLSGSTEVAYQCSPMLVLVQQISVTGDTTAGDTQHGFVSASVLQSWDSDMSVITYTEEGKMGTEWLPEPKHELLDNPKHRSLTLFALPLTGCCAEAQVVCDSVVTPEQYSKPPMPLTAKGKRSATQDTAQGKQQQGNQAGTGNVGGGAAQQSTTYDNRQFSDSYPFFRLRASPDEEVGKPTEVLFAETPALERREVVLTLKNTGASVVAGTLIQDNALRSEQHSFQWSVKGQAEDKAQRVQMLNSLPTRLALLERTFSVSCKYQTDILNIFSCLVAPSKDLLALLEKILGDTNGDRSLALTQLQLASKPSAAILHSDGLPMTLTEEIQGATAFLLQTVCNVKPQQQCPKFPPEIKVVPSGVKGSSVPKQIATKQLVKVKAPTLGKTNTQLPTTVTALEQLGVHDTCGILMAFTPKDEGDFEEYLRFAVCDSSETLRSLASSREGRLPVVGPPIILKGAAFLPILHVELEGEDQQLSEAAPQTSRTLRLTSQAIGAAVEARIILTNPTHESYRCTTESSESSVSLSPAQLVIHPHESAVMFVRFTPTSLQSVSSVVTLRVPEYELAASIDVVCSVHDVAESVALDTGSLKFVVAGAPCEQTVNIVGGGASGTVEYSVRLETVPHYLGVYPTTGVFSIPAGQTAKAPVVISAFCRDVEGLIASLAKKGQQEDSTSATTDDTILFDINGTKTLSLRVTSLWVIVRNKVTPKRIDFGCVWTQGTVLAAPSAMNTASKATATVELTNESALPLLFVLSVVPISASKRGAQHVVGDLSEQAAMGRLATEIQRHFHIGIPEGRTTVEPKSSASFPIEFTPSCELSVGPGGLQAAVSVNVLMTDPRSGEYISVGNYSLHITAKAARPRLLLTPSQLSFGTHYTAPDKDTVDSLMAKVLEKGATSEYIRTVTVTNEEDATAHVDVGCLSAPSGSSSPASVVVSQPSPHHQLAKGESATFNVLVVPHADPAHDIRSVHDTVFVNTRMEGSNTVVSFPLQLSAEICSCKVMVTEPSAKPLRSMRPQTTQHKKQGGAQTELVSLSGTPLRGKDLLTAMRRLREDINRQGTADEPLAPTSQALGFKTLAVENKRTIPLSLGASVEVTRIQDGGPGGALEGVDVGVYAVVTPSDDQVGQRRHATALSKVLNAIMKMEVDTGAQDTISENAACILDGKALLSVLFVPRGRLLTDDIEASGTIKLWSFDGGQQNVVLAIPITLSTGLVGGRK